MAISAATAIAGAQAAGSLMGAMDGGGDMKQAPTSGYQTYPQWLKDIYEETAAPAILEQYNKPYQTLPMARYDADPNDPFTSKALLDYQAFSDATGGMFTPYGAQQMGGNSGADQAAAMQSFRDEMLGRQFLEGLAGQKGYGNVRVDAYTPEELAMFGGATGGASGLAGLAKAQGADDYAGFLETLTAGRVR